MGDSAPGRSFGPLTRTDFVRYAGASGDFNPIHHDEGFATSAGFPTVFSIGMLQAGFLATFATDWLGAEAIRRFRVRFLEQVWPGDVLECSGTVASVEGDTVEVELRCVRQTGGLAISGTASFDLSR
ncbi:MAG TPA: MaoC/PaaZ C-terminal domain-containing protein [Acidimicrobiales bacterium]|nr:MaoC/PaaZ C-terminal domain-containing protein [Acidimicrobiales bacterium]